MEVCAYGYWAMACDSSSYWNSAATLVVCKQLGFPTESIYAMIACIHYYKFYDLKIIMQHLSTYLVVHLNPTISCLLLGSPVTVEPVTSVNANYTIRQIIATTKKQLEYFVKVKYYTARLSPIQL